MNVWTLLSAVAVLAASVPPLYFAARLKRSKPSFTALVLLLAASLLVHGVFHLLDAFSFPVDAVHGVEAVSAVLILVFAVVYWPLRGGTER